MFDYETFENNVVQQMETILNNWIKENNDIYIFSLDCARGMDSIGVIANTTHYLEEQADPDSEDYRYYKYCEDEWELYDVFEAVSAEMNQYLDENDAIFTDSETFEYTEDFDEHCDKMIDCCVNALIRFRQSLNKNHSNIMLDFNIREYLDGEYKVEIFEKINEKSAAKEYAEHIEDYS